MSRSRAKNLDIHQTEEGKWEANNTYASLTGELDVTALHQVLIVTAPGCVGMPQELSSFSIL